MDDFHCSFCGKRRREVRKLISGPRVFICDECVALCNDIIAKEEAQERPKYPRPKEIADELDKYCIGQIRAKKALSVAVYNHYKRVGQKQQGKAGEVEVQKGNVLLLGPTGCGKTLLAQTLAKKLDVPFAIADATTLTEAGYVGEDVESVIKALYRNAGGDIEKTQRGIVCIDEIDKRRRVGQQGLGFGATLSAKNDIDKDELRALSRTEDLIKYGMIPEFMGRLPILVSCDALDVDALTKVLWQPKNALAKQYQRLFELEGVKLSFTEDALRAIAEEAHRRKSGARGLRAIVEEVMLDVMYEIPSLTGVQECVVTREVVVLRERPQLIKDTKKAS